MTRPRAIVLALAAGLALACCGKSPAPTATVTVTAPPPRKDKAMAEPYDSTPRWAQRLTISLLVLIIGYMVGLALGWWGPRG